MTKADSQPPVDAADPAPAGMYAHRVIAELRRVSWPGRRQVVTYTAAVLVFLVVVVAGVWLSDVAAATLMLRVLG